MANNKLDIWNQALSACKANGRVSSEDENSLERQIVEQWYDVTLGTVQEAVQWDCCKATDRIPLLRERSENDIWASGDPDPRYRFRYSLPVNFLRARQLSHGQPFEVVFDITRDRLVLDTNAEDPVLMYTVLNQNPKQWSQSQRMATIYGLAGHISMPLHGVGQLAQQNFQIANKYLEDSQSMDNMSGNEEWQTPAPWHVARGAAELQRPPAYLYPAGQIFVIPEVNATIGLSS